MNGEPADKLLLSLISTFMLIGKRNASLTAIQVANDKNRRLNNSNHKLGTHV
jgi:hypothetical protein